MVADVIELSHSKKNRLPDAPNGRKRWAINASINVLQMKEDGGEWVDIDPENDVLPYEPTIYQTGMPGFHYKSKTSGEFDVRLKAARQNASSISEVPYNQNVKPTKKGAQYIWENFYPSVDIIITKGKTWVKMERQIKSASAPLEYDVIVTEVEKGVAKLRPLKPAIDAEGQLIKMEEKPTFDGRTETLKLEVVEDEDSKAKPIKYPIRDSTVIDVQITNTDHDGSARSNGTAYTDRDYVGYVSSRISHIWQLFNLGTAIGGVTIDTAYSRTYRSSTSGASFASQMFLNYVESPARPTSYSDYNGKALTTEYIDRNVMPAAGWENSASLVDMFQELVDTYNPSSVMVMWRDNGSAATYYKATDYSDDDTLCAELYLEYTEGGWAGEYCGVAVEEFDGVVADEIIGV